MAYIWQGGKEKHTVSMSSQEKERKNEFLAAGLAVNVAWPCFLLCTFQTRKALKEEIMNVVHDHD